MQIAAHCPARPSPRFSGASPELTARFFTQLIPGRNDEAVYQVRGNLRADRVDLSRGRFNHLFAQDPQWVFETEAGKPLAVKAKSVSDVPDFLLGQSEIVPLGSNLYGGNCYLGLRESGKPFCLVGERVINTSADTPIEGLRRVADDLGVKDSRNIVVIPQLSIWYLNDIDTFIRPIGGNKLLVYDPETSRQFLEDNGIQRLSAIEGSEPDKSHAYANIQKILKKKGFEVIKAPGLFHYEGRMATGQTTAFDMSLLNSLVYRNPESGKLTYLTMDPAKPDLKNAFSAWLRKHCPEIEEVVYVDGGGPLQHNSLFPNRMVQIFNEEKGGLHCMFGEVINGKIWREANRRNWNA